MENNDNQTPQTIDIFEWVNNLDEYKTDLTANIYFINKKGTPFAVHATGELATQLAPVFVHGVIGSIQKGAGTGLEVREFEESEAEDNVLLHTTLAKVAAARDLIDTLNSTKSPEIFNEFDHEFKTIIKLVVKFSHKDLAEPFFVVKEISGASSLNQQTSWELNESGKLQPFTPEVGFKVPLDEQVLITGQDIFIFKPTKFTKMFNYNFKQQLITDQKIEEILRNFDLSFPEGVDLPTLLKSNKSLAKKLQDLNPYEVKQADLITHSEEMNLELMADDAGKIIIMDGKDLGIFINLLNDDYVTSDLTGKKYIIRGKKVL
jgi:hypothetical protein